jgi:PleD family two-component response regulator
MYGVGVASFMYTRRRVAVELVGFFVVEATVVAPSTPNPPDVVRAPSGPSYVLIADPDPRRAGMIRDLVELGGYEAIVTRNGDEAKAMLRRRQLPELVVANLSLPRLDGFALLAELRRRKS